MSSKESHKEALEDYVGIEDYRELWKAVKEDLHSRILSGD
jgi:hypothetical protein